MLSPKRLLLEELLDETFDLAENDQAIYLEESSERFNIRKPAIGYLERFKQKDWVFSYGCCEISHGEPTSRYDFNFLNPDDYLLNWDYLSSIEKETFKNLLYSNTYKSPNRFGLKKLNLESHLLFSLGIDMTHILGKSKNYVLSNLKQRDNSTMFLCVNDKNLDPRSSLNAYNKFKKQYQIEDMFSTDTVAYHMLISLDQEYHSIDSLEKSKEVFHNFFKENAKYLTRLCHKKEKVCGYIYSHEISVDSIQNQKYRPHTHVIIFVKKGKDLFQTEQKLLEMESSFNIYHKNRKMSLLKTPTASTTPLKRASSYADIEKSVQYLFRCYSLSETYRREINNQNIQELNQKTKETLYNLIFFFKSCSGDKTIRRFGASKIPKSSRLQKI